MPISCPTFCLRFAIAVVGAVVGVGSVVSVDVCVGQESIPPGIVSPAPPVASMEDDELLAPLNLDALPDGPSATAGPIGGGLFDEELATGEPLRDEKSKAFLKAQEDRILRAERAKLEARARFEARSRDLIPRLQPVTEPPTPANDSASESTSLEDAIGPRDGDRPRPLPRVDGSTTTRRLDIEEEDLASPSDRPFGDSMRDRPAEPTDLESLPPPRLPRQGTQPNLPQVKPVQPPDRPRRLGARDDAPAGETPATTLPNREPAAPATSPPKPNDQKPSDQASSPRSVLNTPAPVHGFVSPPMPTHLPLEPFAHWPTPAGHSFASTMSMEVNCSACGGCVDRDGVGLRDEVHTYLGVGTRAKKKCQCWRCPQGPPFNLYGPGSFAGPARPAPLREYRLRSGDQLQLTFLIRSVQTSGAYRLVVGDELLIESEADEKLTRGTLERGLEVQPDGTISLRFIGEVHAAGRTIDQLRDVLNERYEYYYPEPSIDVTPVRTGSIARQIREAISGSEGFNAQTTIQTITPEGSIRLPRIGAVPAQGLTLAELKREINLRYNAIAAGLEVEPNLEQQAPHYVYVLGETLQPGRFEVDAPTTVMGAIALAGGWVPGANLRQVVVFRRGPNWELVSTLLDLRGALLGKEANPADEIWIQDGDVIVLPPTPIRLFDRFVNQVFTEGLYGIVPNGGVSYAFGNNN